MRRKTQEEKRETNRKKQARWRARHREEWIYRQKKLATYGKAQWQKEGVAVTDNPKATELAYVACDEGGQEVVVAEGNEPQTQEEHRVAEQLAKMVAKRKVTDNPKPKGIEVDLGL